MRNFLIFVVLIFFSLIVKGQNIITGKIISKNNVGIAGVSVSLKSKKILTFSDSSGYFRIAVTRFPVHLHFSRLGFKDKDTLISKSGFYIIKLQAQVVRLQQVEATAFYSQNPGVETFGSKQLEFVPSASGNAVETLIMTAMGVQTANEFSSQYNVRGGNFDENLVYIDGIKVYRPIMIHSAQQEGLSIVNSDMVRNIRFSAGGFGAQFGDKMSSVLDIDYKRPKSFAMKLGLGMTGANVFYQNYFSRTKTSLMFGLRLKKNTYLLSALPVKGNYKPLFADFQSVLRVQLTKKLQMSVFDYFAHNSYNFYPDSQTVAVGTFSANFRIPIFYQGQERDLYNSTLHALTFLYRPKPNISVKNILSVYFSDEQERYTTSAYYRLDFVTRQFTGSQRDSMINIGEGMFMDYARNFLDLALFSNRTLVNVQLSKHSLLLGAEYTRLRTHDFVDRWKYIDSAGYSFTMGRGSADQLNLFSSEKAENFYHDYRVSFFLQDFRRFYIGLDRFNLNLGIRYTYWSYGRSHLFQPRITVYYVPDWYSKWNFRLSAGVYYQVPFYGELRNLDGKLTSDPHAEKSIHLVLGAYKEFRMWNRPFKFSTEWYYKWLRDLVPYEFDNMRIQYYANEISNGFVYGADFRLYGQFVPETDSWITVSLMHTAEDIVGDQYWRYYDINGHATIKAYAVDSVLVKPGYIPRPTDQLLTVSMFFQDYMPQNRNIRVSLGLFYGSGRPFGPPAKGRAFATLRMPAYLRADLGFIFVLHPKFAKSIILQIDMFNAFDARNVASYSWLTVLANPALIGGNPLGNSQLIQIAAPNFMTGRLINFDVKINLK